MVRRNKQVFLGQEMRGQRLYSKLQNPPSRHWGSRMVYLPGHYSPFRAPFQGGGLGDSIPGSSHNTLNLKKKKTFFKPLTKSVTISYWSLQWEMKYIQYSKRKIHSVTSSAVQFSQSTAVKCTVSAWYWMEGDRGGFSREIITLPSVWMSDKLKDFRYYVPESLLRNSWFGTCRGQWIFL